LAFACDDGEMMMMMAMMMMMMTTTIVIISQMQLYLLFLLESHFSVKNEKKIGHIVENTKLSVTSGKTSQFLEYCAIFHAHILCSIALWGF